MKEIVQAAEYMAASIPPQNGGMTPVREALIKLVRTIPEEKQLSWLQLCVGKANIKEALEKRELELQGLLANFKEKLFPGVLNWDKDKEKIVASLLTLQNTIAEYKKGARELPEMRKAFTRYLDKIYTELMEPEKRAAAWETLAEAEKFFLEMREQKELIDSKDASKQNEQAAFLAHVKNEYARLTTEYKLLLEKQITDAYVWCLNDTQLTEDGLKQYIKLTWEEMKKLQPPPRGKFEYHFNTREEIVALIDKIEKPNYIAILNASQKDLLAKFQMYWNDRANAEQAKKFQEAQLHQHEEESRSAVQRSIGVNNLLAASGATHITESIGLKKIATKETIVIEDDNPAWANKIVAAFLEHWPKAAQHLRIKKWGNLNVSQMAAALDEAEIKVPDVQYETITK